MRRLCLIPLAAILLLFGCTMAPKYARPAMPVPDAWAEQHAAPTGEAQASAAISNIKWTDFFADPHFRYVIQLALDNNRDLRIATLNVQKAQALYRIQRSELFPTIGLQAQGDKYRIPEKMSALAPPGVYEQDTVEVGVSSWELDLFGRIRSLKSKALNQYFSTVQAQRAARVSLIAAVAASYLALAADTEQMELSHSTLETQTASYEMIKASASEGIASDLDLRQAQSQVEASRVDFANYAGLVALDKHLLDQLVGTPVPQDLLPSALAAVIQTKDLEPGLPSDVLLCRPDVLSAEYQLKAANANIGAARAAFFPRITLTAGVGTMSPELSGLFDSGTKTWSFTPQIVSPIFASGSLLANLKASKVDRDIAIAQYEKSIQSAFREVSDSLALRATLAQQQEAQESLVAALDQSYRLSDARYKEGLDSYLGVLVNQRALYMAQRGLVSVRLAREMNRVTLYKVLGGGA